MTLRRPTIIDRLIPHTDLLLESPLAAPRRAGGQASGLVQQAVQRQQQRVTRWDRVQTRIETRHIRSHRYSKEATAGSEEVMQEKGPRERENLQVQARHLVPPDMRAQDLDQLGDAEFDDDYINNDGEDDECETLVESIDDSDLSSTDSSSTYSPPSKCSSDSCSDLPALESLDPELPLPSYIYEETSYESYETPRYSSSRLESSRCQTPRYGTSNYDSAECVASRPEIHESPTYLSTSYATITLAKSKSPSPARNYCSSRNKSKSRSPNPQISSSSS